MAAMLWLLVAILLALWLFGLLLKIAGLAIHVLLLVAVVIIVWRLVTNRGRVL
jgi:hypothetical protein